MLTTSVNMMMMIRTMHYTYIYIARIYVYICIYIYGALHHRNTASVFSFHILSFADSCGLLVPWLSRPTDWSRMFVDCIHVIFCHPLCYVTGFNAICNACLAGVPSGSLKMCLVNLSLF